MMPSDQEHQEHEQTSGGETDKTTSKVVLRLFSPLFFPRLETLIAGECVENDEGNAIMSIQSEKANLAKDQQELGYGALIRVRELQGAGAHLAVFLLAPHWTWIDFAAHSEVKRLHFLLRYVGGYLVFPKMSFIIERRPGRRASRQGREARNTEQRRRPPEVGVGAGGVPPSSWILALIKSHTHARTQAQAQAHNSSFGPMTGCTGVFKTLCVDV